VAVPSTAPLNLTLCGAQSKLLRTAAGPYQPVLLPIFSCTVPVFQQKQDLGLTILWRREPIAQLRDHRLLALIANISTSNFIFDNLMDRLAGLM
jgi:hypothetical protein